MAEKRSKKNVLIPSAMMAIVGLLVGTAVGPAPLAASIFGADGPDIVHVAAGHVRVLDAPLTVETLFVEGTVLSAPGTDLVIHAMEVRLGEHAQLRAADGERGARALANDARGGHGSDGRDIFLMAESLLADGGAVLRAGDGGGGGDALGAVAAWAGDGGDGGNVFVHAAVVEARGLARPGSGGHGGDARTATIGSVPSNGTSLGGAGGDSGLAFVNGKLWHDLAADHLTSTRVLAYRHDAVDLCGRVAAFVPLGRNCLDVPVPVLATSAAASTALDPCSFSAKACLVVNEKIIAIIQGIIAGDPGVPGLPGLVQMGCNTPEGAPGTPGTLDGGDGGDACTEVWGSAGGNGGKGSDGTGNCGAGGPGGPGGQASGISATGGLGGQGYRNGGNGGGAYAAAYGGNGGDGGRGGMNSIGANCPGGAGGPGGNAVGGKATGGAGGEGLCGHGGQGGQADSPGSGGAGGAGGSGNPAGLGGAAGTSATGATTAGKGGEGLGVCPATP